MTPSPTPTIGNRYLLYRHLGTGGMGTVYQATDRLTGQVVALKQVTAPETQLQFATYSHTTNLRVALAQEFKTLASLRHPHIVSVLDYGFDHLGQPYFTMNLLHNAQTILQAGANQPTKTQLDLLIQLLQALAYLHQRGILHRDLKPENVLVVNNQVKVLDFGLSVSTVAPESSSSITSTTAGTFAYMAPELFLNESPSQAADLYAVGLLTYELLAGQYPFNKGNMAVLVNEILNTPPNVRALGQNNALTAVLEKLLLKTAADRYQDAHQVIKELCAATHHPLPQETVEIRESYLQAAKFIGRKKELAHLANMLAQAVNGTGTACLIGGESGVGKSRLSEEIRIQALVQGVLVLRGQAIQDGGSPYQVWQNILRWLVIVAQPTDGEASVLKPFVPDISTLLDQEVADAPTLDPQATQNRLHQVIVDLFQRLSQPVMLLLEDLHWASSNSLDMFNHLNHATAHLSLLILGTYRDDERPDLPALLSHAHLIKLERLTQDDIAELSTSMLDKGGQQQQLVDLLQRETEGNPFFLVEVVRALAEEAGELNQIASMTLPQHILTGGLQKLIQRRLNQVPPRYRPLLHLAAISGRSLDLRILHHLHQDAASESPFTLEEWVTVCANAAVLEIQENQWRFAHDKLREYLLAHLPEQTLCTLHQQIAQTIEHLYPHDNSQQPRLAYHWSAAANKEKEAHYATLAGYQAFNIGANESAVTFFEQALTALKALPITKERQLQQIDVTLKLERAASFLSNTHISELLDQALETAKSLGDEVLLARVYGSIGAYHYVRGENEIAFPNFSHSMALAEKLGLDELLAVPYNLIGRAIFIGGDYPQATAMLAKGIKLAEEYLDPELLSGSLAFYAASLACQGQRDEAAVHTQRALEVAQEIDHPSRISANHMIAGFYHTFCGDFETAIDYMTRCLAISDQTQDLPIQYIAHGFLGYIYIQQEAWEKATYHVNQSVALANERSGRPAIHGPTYQALQAVLMAREGQLTAAIAQAEAAMATAQATRQGIAQGLVQQVLSKLLIAQPTPDWTRAEQLLQECLAIYERGNGRPFMAVATFDLCQLYAAWGRREQAQTLLQQAQDAFATLAMPWYQEQARQFETTL